MEYIISEPSFRFLTRPEPALGPHIFTCVSPVPITRTSLRKFILKETLICRKIPAQSRRNRSTAFCLSLKMQGGQTQFNLISSCEKSFPWMHPSTQKLKDSIKWRISRCWNSQERTTCCSQK